MEKFGKEIGNEAETQFCGSPRNEQRSEIMRNYGRKLDAVSGTYGPRYGVYGRFMADSATIRTLLIILREKKLIISLII